MSTKLYYFALIAGSVTFQHKETGDTVTHRANYVSKQDFDEDGPDPVINAEALEHFAEGLTDSAGRMHNLDPNVYGVLSPVIDNVVMLGLMTDAQFTKRSPEAPANEPAAT